MCLMLASNAVCGYCVVKPLYAEEQPLTVEKPGTAARERPTLRKKKSGAAMLIISMMLTPREDSEIVDLQRRVKPPTVFHSH